MLTASDLWQEYNGTIHFLCDILYLLSMHTYTPVGNTCLPCFLLSLRYFLHHLKKLWGSGRCFLLLFYLNVRKMSNNV